MAAKPRRSIVWRVTALLAALVVLMQLVPFGRDHTNPPVVQEPAWDSDRTRQLFFRACADCHSNETVWPWYSIIAPVSWLVQRDVNEGRSKFNISMWGHQKKNEGDEAAEMLEDGEMPLPPYVMMHEEARLSPTEQSELIQGLKKTFGERRKKQSLQRLSMTVPIATFGLQAYGR